MIMALLIASLSGFLSTRLHPLLMGFLVTALSLVLVWRILEPESVLGFGAQFVLLQTVGEISYLVGLSLIL